MSMTRQGWCFAPSASSSCYAHSSLWASLRFSKSHGLAHETQAMCLLKWKAANGETQPNVWCVTARSSEKGSWPIRTKFFFSACRAETVFNICQMSRPTVKTTNGRGSCQGQPAKCRTKSPGRHSWADQSLEAGGTNAFRWAWHRFEVGPVDSDRSMRLYLHLHHITVYTVYICVCA